MSGHTTCYHYSYRAVGKQCELQRGDVTVNKETSVWCKIKNVLHNKTNSRMMITITEVAKKFSKYSYAMEEVLSRMQTAIGGCIIEVVSRK